MRATMLICGCLWWVVGCGGAGETDVESRAGSSAVEEAASAVGEGDEAAAGQGLEVEPLSAAPGAEVTLEARGLPASTRVGVGYGPPASEYRIVRHEETDAEGRLSTTVTVPESARPGAEVIFAVAVSGTDFELLSEPFTVE